MGIRVPSRYLLISGLLLASLVAEAETPLYFVFDIDDTIARWVRPVESKQGNITSLIHDPGTAKDYQYRILDGAGETIQALLERVPGSKIAFYSGGPRERNLKLLGQLVLPDGRRAIDVASSVLSRGDIVPENALPSASASAWRNLNGSPPETMHYDLRRHGRKDLLKAAPDLEKVILLDDRLGYAFPGQEKNLLWVGTPLSKHPEAFVEADNVTREAYIQYRNKLTRMIGLIDLGLEFSEKEKIPLPEALWKIQWLTDAEGKLTYNTKLLTDASIYRRGARLLAKTKSTRYQFTTPLLERKPGCLVPLFRLLR